MYGGDRIKRKILLSVLLLFGLALILNVSTSAAANVTTLHKSPKVTTVDPVNNTVISKSKTTISALTIKKPKTVSSKTVSATASLAKIMKTAAKFRYSSAAHTGAAMERIGSGDCWAMSDYLYTHMKKAGIKARIIQYATAYSSRHRSVQYFSSGKWVDAPYRAYGLNRMFNNTKSFGTVIKC
jgi:hypothetical protein